MAERVDVLIAGSGLRRLDHRLPAGRGLPRRRRRPEGILVLERGQRYGHTDFKQSMDIEHLSSVYQLIQGQGAQVVDRQRRRRRLEPLPRRVAARARRETFERRDHRPGDGPDRRMWPTAISRARRSTRTTRARSAALRVHRPAGTRCRSPAGCGRRRCNAAGHTCDRVPLAICPERCVNAKWCHTGCIFGAKNSLITNYLAARGAARRAGAARAPRSSRSASRGAALPLRRDRRRDDNEARARAPADRRPSRSSARC